jgi:hypothetical protein
LVTLKSRICYDILEAIENPFMIYEGSNRELIAVSSWFLQGLQEVERTDSTV